MITMDQNEHDKNDLDAAWAEEINRRVKEMEEGKAWGISHEQVTADVLAWLHGRGGNSPLDVPGIDVRPSADEIIVAVREGRER